jgi:hypothetical protein
MILDRLYKNQVTIPSTQQTQRTIPGDPLQPSPEKKSVEGLANGASKNLESLKQIYSEKDLKKLGIIECET